MEKILFIIGSLSGGGAERVVSTLASEMVNKGYEVNIITIYDDKNDYVIDERINIKHIENKSKLKLFKGVNIVRKLNNIIKNVNPDLIISFDSMVNIYSILSKNILKNKIIISERNDPYKYPGNKAIRVIRNLLYLKADGIVFQTIDAKNYFYSSIQKKSIIISNPIKCGLPNWNRQSNDKTIITASRLMEQKNIPMLIDAFKEISSKYPEYKLKIFGKGELYEHLNSKINNMNLSNKITLCGFSNNIHNEIANADLFVISSNYEGISNSMLESLAIGTPTISTDAPIGGARMFIENNVNGILINVGDKNELVEAMDKILSSKEFANQLSNQAVKIREKLRADKIVDEWIKYALNIYGGTNDKKHSKAI